MTAKQLIETIDDLSHTLRFLKWAGCPGFTCTEENLARLDHWGRSPSPPADRGMEGIRAELGDCRRCRLARNRRNIVFGSGDPKARLIFVGEAPGYDEDLKGEPFVGPAGRLLTKSRHPIHCSRRWLRGDVYIVG